MTNHQRKDALSNTAVGADFEKSVLRHLKPQFSSLIQPFWLPIGYLTQKNHKFDLGCSQNKVIVECKSHTWTESGNIPSAKITTWDQAMLYFFLAPRGYKKIFAVKRDINPKTQESLAEYYVRTHFNVIPDEVEFVELDEKTDKLQKVEFEPTSHVTGKKEHVRSEGN